MHQGPPPGPRQMPTSEHKPKLLTFEEFNRRRASVPRYGNFFVYFANNSTEGRRARDWYKKFAFEHSDINTSLCDKIQNRRDKSKGTSESLKPFDRDLYEAYIIMRTYGVSDRDLFS